MIFQYPVKIFEVFGQLAYPGEWGASCRKKFSRYFFPDVCEFFAADLFRCISIRPFNLFFSVGIQLFELFKYVAHAVLIMLSASVSPAVVNYRRN